MNLLDIVKSQLTSGSTLGAISNLLGENDTATKTGLGAALPMLLGSVIKSGSTTEGASGLMNLIKSGGYDGSGLNNIAGLLNSGSGADSFLKSGSGLISTLLGDKLSSISSLVSNLSGLKGSSVSTLLNLAAPFLLGTIGKQVTSQGIGVSGLISLLKDQIVHVKDALPAGASNLLGFGDFGGISTPTVPTVEEATSGMGKWLPWILALAVLAGLLYYWKGCSKTEVKAPVVETPKDITPPVAKAPEAFMVKIPSGASLNVPKGSLEDRIVTFIESKDTISKNLWFDFDRLLFETGKSMLKDSSMAQLKNVAAIMAAYPKVEIKIGGYTDNVGNAAGNMKLSSERAKTVMAELVKLGVGAPRMSAEGYGDQHPLASNNTEAGKAQNRRISISVRKK